MVNTSWCLNKIERNGVIDPKFHTYVRFVVFLRKIVFFELGKIFENISSLNVLFVFKVLLKIKLFRAIFPNQGIND